jgi:hypothetical protein
MAVRAPGASTGRGTSADDVPLIIGGVGLLLILLLGSALTIDMVNLDVWTALFTGVVLLLVSIPVFTWMGKREGWPRMAAWLTLALVTKFVFSLIRYFVIFRVYKGEGDAGIYVEAAAELAKRLRLGLPLHPLDHRINSFPVASQYMGDITGFIFYLTGASKYATFMIYGWFCFIGQLMACQALKIAVPEARYRRYVLLVLFLPSLLFWPSSAGKEAVMVLCFGLCALGAAMLLGPKTNLWGFLPFLAGCWGAFLIRPHIAVMALAALAAAFGIGAVLGTGSGADGSDKQKTSSRAVRIVGLVVMLAVFAGASSQLGKLLGGEDTGGGAGESATELLEKTAEQSSIGNSAFTPPMVSNPVKVPWGLASVLFRPFPWEANGGSLIAAAESALLGALFVLSAGRLLTLWPLLRRRAYLVFVVAFAIEFAIAFSYIGNFGILARQRVMMLPAVLVLLALPTRKELAEYDEEHAQAEVPARGRLAQRPGTLGSAGTRRLLETNPQR